MISILTMYLIERSYAVPTNSEKGRLVLGDQGSVKLCLPLYPCTQNSFRHTQLGFSVNMCWTMDRQRLNQNNCIEPLLPRPWAVPEKVMRESMLFPVLYVHCCFVISDHLPYQFLNELLAVIIIMFLPLLSQPCTIPKELEWTTECSKSSQHILYIPSEHFCLPHFA